MSLFFIYEDIVLSIAAAQPQNCLASPRIVLGQWKRAKDHLLQRSVAASKRHNTSCCFKAAGRPDAEAEADPVLILRVVEVHWLRPQPRIFLFDSSRFGSALWRPFQAKTAGNIFSHVQLQVGDSIWKVSDFQLLGVSLSQTLWLLKYSVNTIPPDRRWQWQSQVSVFWCYYGDYLVLR